MLNVRWVFDRGERETKASEYTSLKTEPLETVLVRVQVRLNSVPRAFIKATLV